MGRQSSRIFFQGKDHKDIYFQGHYHDKMYIGSTLVWEKLKSMKINWEVYETSIYAVTNMIVNNGDIFCFIDKRTGNIYTSSNGKIWSITENPFTDFRMDSGSIRTDGNTFVASKQYRYGDGIYRVQPVVSPNGLTWEKIDSVNVTRKNGTILHLKTDGTGDEMLNLGFNGKANGLFISNSGSPMYGSSFNSMKYVSIKSTDGEHTASKMQNVKYINKYYYFFTDIGIGSCALWRTKDFSKFDFLTYLIGASSLGSAIINKFENRIYVSSGTAQYVSEDGNTFSKNTFLSTNFYEASLDFWTADNEKLVQAYSGAFYVNNRRYYTKDFYENSLRDYNPHVNIINNKVYIFYTSTGTDKPIIVFIGTKEDK